jgi:hypothetical protein
LAEKTLIRLTLGTRAESTGFGAKSSTNHGEIAPIARAYSNMALRARVLPALAGSLSSTFWVKKASGMDEAPMPVAPPTTQPRDDATSCVDAEASKGMRMAQGESNSFWQRTGFDFFQTHVSGTEGCLRRHAERKARRRKAAAGGEKAATAGKGNGTRSSCQASNASRSGGFG